MSSLRLRMHGRHTSGISLKLFNTDNLPVPATLPKRFSHMVNILDLPMMALEELASIPAIRRDR